MEALVLVTQCFIFSVYEMGAITEENLHYYVYIMKLCDTVMRALLNWTGLSCSQANSLSQIENT